MKSSLRSDRAISAPARGAAICLLAIACGEYAHTNPYDPATRITISIAGPDSAHSIHEGLTFTYQVDRSWEGVPPVWQSGNDAVLGELAPGQFQTNGVGTANVLLSVGAHTALHRVVVVQRPKHAFFCYFAGCPTSLAVGGVATLSLVQTDSLGTALLPGQAPATLQYDVRPAGVLQITAESPLSVQVKAVGIGRVFVIAALGASLDSVPITVQ